MSDDGLHTGRMTAPAGPADTVTTGTMPSARQAMADYEKDVLRCQDGRPIVSFTSWCHYMGINPWELK